MSRNASTARGKTRTRRKRLPNLRSLLKEQGRSAAWLSRTTGYSESQIHRVASGDHPGSARFHFAMRQALGDGYAA